MDRPITWSAAPAIRHWKRIQGDISFYLPDPDNFVDFTAPGDSVLNQYHD
jgi:hypothetical protein